MILIGTEIDMDTENDFKSSKRFLLIYLMIFYI